MRWVKMCDILKSVQCLNLDAEPHFRTLHWVRCQCVCRHHLASVLLPHVKTWIFRFIYSWSILRWSFGAHMRCVASNRQCTLYIAHHLHQHKTYKCYVTSKILFIYFRRTVLLEHFVLPGKFEIFCSSQVCLMIFRPQLIAFRMIGMMWETTISIHSFLFIWKIHAYEMNIGLFRIRHDSILIIKPGEEFIDRILVMFVAIYKAYIGQLQWSGSESLHLWKLNDFTELSLKIQK